MKTSNESKQKNQSSFCLKSRSILAISSLVIAAFTVASSALADDQPTNVPPAVTSQSVTAPSDARYGLFNALDHRSSYGQGAFPEPFLVDDSDLEVNEARLDFTYSQAHNENTYLLHPEVEKGFGNLTLEIEAPYEIDTTRHPSHTTDGFDNVDLGARYPLYQYVSENKFIDTTFGAGIEVGIPTYSSISEDFEIVPKIFNDLRIAEKFTMQTILGYSKLSGPGDDGGLETFEYGFVFGYSIPHSQLPIPHVLEFIPVFELSGETGLNNGQSGQNSLTGNAAVRFNMKTIGKVQPRLGVGYIFPMDSNARDDMHWGVITSLVFEY